VVAGLIILFSKQLIDNARQAITQINTHGVTKEQVVQLETVQRSDVINLAGECVRQNYKQTFEKKLCFVITGKNFPPPSDYDNQQLDYGFATNASGVNGSYNALILTFDPVGAQVLIIK
jgi:hypothetical protein